MAKPIKVTPVLRGQDAINFLKRLNENLNKKVSADVLLDIRTVAEKFQAILVK
jgi:hypothetical protein